jgi:formylmethanofuran dehydrogenase subunit E
MKKWMLREGKLSRDEEKELGMELLKLNEEYLDIIDVTINFESTFDNSKIVKCEKCDELIPIGITVMKDKILCKACAGKAYYST